ncbi:MRNA export factor like [Actinidia chinensis var. chinensis]|uniref:mRNA export factor like n=1 Tax=Actinidia chinensis var. chinensis TaxID=1590841 RepID=A0A2R6PFQ4_ACTCC|nr:MRNA export factor like [Actinidia chinensis var. chinensis]
MTLTIGAGGGAGILHGGHHHLLHRPILSPHSPSNPQFASRNSHIVVKAAKKLTPRTGKFDSKNRRSSSTTTKEEEKEEGGTVQFGPDAISDGIGAVDVSGGDDGFVVSDLPGLKPDFWEGPQWDGLGFFVQYMWAFGIGFALVACGIAVATYNEGATDFKATPAYKESIQSRELLEEPEGSNSDVFELNPTEEAPSLE